MAHTTDLTHAAHCLCESPSMCASDRPGHALGRVQLAIAAATPSQWRDAVVAELRSDGGIDLACLDGDRLTVWNHVGLAGRLTVGEPVAVHGRYSVLAAGAARYNVVAH